MAKSVFTRLLDGVQESTDVSSVFRSSFPSDDVERTDFRLRSWNRELPRPGEEVKTYHSTVVHALSAAAKVGEGLGVTLLPEDEAGTPEFRSYAQIYREARTLCSVLKEGGLKEGDRVLLVLPTSFEFLVCFFAIQMAGAIPAPSYPPALLERAESALERLQHIINHSRSSACISNRMLMTLVGGLGLRCKSLRHLWTVETLLSKRPTKSARVSLRGSAPAFIQYTSGSTGNPKGVLLSHRNLVANLHAAGQAGKIHAKEVVVSWLPLYHDMGLIGSILFGVYWKFPVVLMSPLTFISRPIRWLEAIHEYKGTYSPAPNFAYGLCVKRIRPREREGLDLSSWRLALNGAEPVNVKTLKEFCEAFGPHGFREQTFFPCYGLAESTVAVTFSEPRRGYKFQTVDRAALAQGNVVRSEGPGSVALVSCGKAIPGHEIRIVDDKLSPVGEQKVGHILVRGPSVMQGYYRDEEATAKTLRAGWLWTGDLGYQTEDGLFVTGRAKDLIIVRGKNYYAEDLEHVAERVEGVRPSGVVAFCIYDEQKASDLTVVVCETKLTLAKDRERLVEAVSEAIAMDCSLRVDEVVLVPPSTLPRTSSGKRQRSLTRDLYLKDELRPRATGKLKIAWLFARSGAGFASLVSRRWNARRRSPE